IRPRSAPDNSTFSCWIASRRLRPLPLAGNTFASTRTAASRALSAMAEYRARHEQARMAAQYISHRHGTLAGQLDVSEAQGTVTTGNINTSIAGGNYFAARATGIDHLCTPDLHRRVIKHRPGHRPRIEGANHVEQLCSRALPVDARIILAELVRVGDAVGRLHNSVFLQRGQIIQCLDQSLGTEGRQPVMDTAAGIVIADRRALFQQHRAGVQPSFHLHDADAGFRVARLDGTLDRRRATPAWQQRTVDIDTAITGNIEY